MAHLICAPPRDADTLVVHVGTSAQNASIATRPTGSKRRRRWHEPWVRCPPGSWWPPGPAPHKGPDWAQEPACRERGGRGILGPHHGGGGRAGSGVGLEPPHFDEPRAQTFPRLAAPSSFSHRVRPRRHHLVEGGSLRSSDPRSKFRSRRRCASRGGPRERRLERQRLQASPARRMLHQFDDLKASRLQFRAYLEEIASLRGRSGDRDGRGPPLRPHAVSVRGGRGQPPLAPTYAKPSAIGSTHSAIGARELLCQPCSEGRSDSASGTAHATRRASASFPTRPSVSRSTPQRFTCQVAAWVAREGRSGTTRRLLVGPVVGRTAIPPSEKEAGDGSLIGSRIAQLRSFFVG